MYGIPEPVQAIGTSMLTGVHAGIVVILTSKPDSGWMLRLGVNLPKS